MDIVTIASIATILSIPISIIAIGVSLWVKDYNDKFRIQIKNQVSTQIKNEIRNQIQNLGTIGTVTNSTVTVINNNRVSP